MTDETLYGIHADRCRYKGIPDQGVMDLGGIHAGKKMSAGTVRFSEWLRQDSGGTAGMRVQ